MKDRISELKEDLSSSPLRTSKDAQEEDPRVQMISVAFVAENSIMKDVSIKGDVNLIGLKQDIYPPPEPKKLSDLSPWQLPAVVSTFVKRPELIDAIKSPLEQKEFVVLSALSGLGGIGKTQLAAYYCHSEEAKNKYTARIWFNAESEERLALQYEELGLAAGIITDRNKNIDRERKVQLVKGWLSHPDNQGWLLIYDNSPNEGVLASYRPTEGGYILITSRSAVWEIPTVKIPFLREEQAKELICKQSGCLVEEPALTRLVSELGCLPLALAQAGAYIKINLRYSQEPIAEYLRMYLENKTKLLQDESLKHRLVQGEKAHELTYFTFDINFQTLAESAPLSLRFMYYSCLLASEPIPMEALQKALACCQVNEDSLLGTVLTGLEEYSLLQIDQDKRVVNLHRVLKVLLKERFNQLDWNQRWAVLYEVSQGVIDNFQERNFSMEDVRRRIGLTVHLESLLREYDALVMSGSEKSEFKREWSLLEAKLLFRLSIAYSLAGNTIRTKECLERALKIQESSGDQDDIEVARILVNLSTTYGDLGEHSNKKDLLEGALSMLESYYGHNHIEIAMPLGNLATACVALGDSEQAKGLLERALAILKTNYSKDKDYVQFSRTLANLAIVYLNLKEPEKAKGLLKYVLPLQEAYFGSDHFEVATMLMNLAVVYGNLKEPEKEKALLKRALTIQENHYGKDHFHIASTLMNLATAYGALKDHQKAKTLLKRALKIEEFHYGKNHIELAMVLWDLSNAYMALKKPLKQKAFLDRVLKIEETHYGRDKIEVTRTLVSLALAHMALREYEKARDILKRVLEISEAYYDQNHVDVGRILLYLALAYQNLGQTIPALSLMRQVHISMENAGASDTSVVKDIVELFSQNAMRELRNSFPGGFSEEDRVLVELINGMCLAEQLPNNGELYEYLGSYFLRLNHPHYAIHYYEQAINCITPKIKELVYHSLACCYHVLGKITEARMYFEAGIAKAPTPDIHLEYAHFLYGQGEYPQALEQIKASLDLPLQTKALGYGAMHVDFIEPGLRILWQQTQQQGERVKYIALPIHVLAYYLAFRCHQCLGNGDDQSWALGNLYESIQEEGDPKLEALWTIAENPLDIFLEETGDRKHEESSPAISQASLIAQFGEIGSRSDLSASCISEISVVAEENTQLASLAPYQE